MPLPFFRRGSLPARSNQPAAKKRRPAFRIGRFELLEDRLAPTVTPVYNLTDTLTITFDSLNDTAVVSSDGTNIWVNGADTGAPAASLSVGILIADTGGALSQSVVFDSSKGAAVSIPGGVQSTGIESFTVNTGNLKLRGTGLSATTSVSVAGGSLDLNGISATVAGVQLVSGSILDSPATATLSTAAVIDAQDGTISARLGGAAAIAKTTGGVLILSGANTFSGATTISAGTVRLGNALALGTTVGATTVSTGATLDLNGQTVGAEPVTVNGTFSATVGGLTNSSGTASSISGSVALGASGGSIGGAGNIVLSVGLAGGNVAFSKVGSGILTLQASSTTRTTAAATTTVDGGVLRVSVNSPLGTSGTANTFPVAVNNNAVLEIQATGLLLTQAYRITLNNGATIRSSGSNQTNSQVNVAAGASVTFATVGAADVFAIGNDANDLTGGDATSIVNIAGPGIFVAGFANNYVGRLNVAASVLRLGSSTGLGTGAGSLTLAAGTTITSTDTNARTIANPLIINGSIAIGAATTQTGALTFSGATQSISNNATLTFAGGTHVFNTGPMTLNSNLTLSGASATFSGGFALAGANRVITNNAAGTVSFGGALGSTTTGQTLTLAGKGATITALNLATAGTGGLGNEVKTFLNGTTSAEVYTFNGAAAGTSTGGVELQSGLIVLNGAASANNTVTVVGALRSSPA